MGILHCGNTAVLAKAVFEKRAIRQCSPCCIWQIHREGPMPLPFYAAGGGLCAVSHFLASDGPKVCPSLLNCWVMSHESA